MPVQPVRHGQGVMTRARATAPSASSRARPVGLVWRRCLAWALPLLFLCAEASANAGNLALDIEQQFRRGETAQAEQRVDQALLEQPSNAHLRFLKAVLLSETGRQDDATRLFQRLVQDHPELPEPHNNLAVLQAAAGQLDEARALLETALRLAPEYRVARENLGDVFVRLAHRAYQRAADGAPAEPRLLRKLAMARALGETR